MVDKTIPFYDIIMRCDDPQHIQVTLPEGFYFDTYRDGDDEAWARMELYAGDFKTYEIALGYFRSAYLTRREELEKRFVQVRNPEGVSVCSCIAWKTFRNEFPAAALQWLVTAEGYEGLGLAKATAFETVNRYRRLGEAPIWLHTQPWSYKAVWLYYQAGFRIAAKDQFQTFNNRFDQAMPVLETLIPPEKMQLLRDSVLYD